MTQRGLLGDTRFEEVHSGSDRAAGDHARWAESDRLRAKAQAVFVAAFRSAPTRRHGDIVDTFALEQCTALGSIVAELREFRRREAADGIAQAELGPRHILWMTADIIAGVEIGAADQCENDQPADQPSN